MKKLAIRLGLKDKGSKSPVVPSEVPIQSDPLGLHVLYTPEERPTVDIVFVHSIQGSSIRSWCKYGDPALFWPQQFLPQETDIRLGRILTFGYKADFGKDSQASIRDFGANLLFDLAHTKVDGMRNHDIGSVPIIFVGHAMGGIVVKDAFVKSEHDSNYRHIHESIAAILFLATPHRGTNLASTLNQILRLSIGFSPAPFIADISATSMYLQSLSDEFRHVATKLQLVSFYETRKTKMGPSTAFIVEKDSAVLGFPAEMSRALDADHRNMSKFHSPEDPNYIVVRNALQSLISRVLPKAPNQAVSHFESLPAAQIGLYNPLSFENFEIRLMKLLPDIDRSSTIRCTIENVSLIDPPSYKALSYCWGNPNIVETIKVNGIVTKATTNLVSALRQLRSYGWDTLWVDALCINQLDREERALQVHRMKDIYSHATEVIVWVGTEDEYSTKALDFMEQLEMGPDTMADEQLRSDSTHAQGSISDSREACDNFFARPYWLRSWIIQEIAVAAKVRVQCGERTISWEAVANGLSRTGLVDLDGFRESVRRSKLRTLLQALYDSRASLATDPRDKLYALLGLTVDGNDIIRLPNYKQPIEVVLTQATKSILLRTRNLDIIALRLADHEDNPNLPSWVPNWTRLADIVRAWQVQHLYSPKQAIASRETWLHNGFKFDGANLIVTGIICDTIHKVSISFRKDQEDALIPYPEVVDIGIAFKYISDNLSRLWVSDVADVNSLLENAYRDLQRWIDENRTFLIEAGHDQSLDYLLRSLHKPFGTWYIEDINKPFQKGGQVSSKTVLDTLKGIFEGGTKLLITTDGNCGIGHPRARRGDIICKLTSSKTPIILRENGDAWTVIGDGYLNTQPDDKKLTHPGEVRQFVLR